MKNCDQKIKVCVDLNRITTYGHTNRIMQGKKKYQNTFEDCLLVVGDTSYIKNNRARNFERGRIFPLFHKIDGFIIGCHLLFLKLPPTLRGKY